MSLSNGKRPEKTHRAVLVQQFLTRYRTPFLERVRSRLLEEAIVFDVVHGQPSGADALKGATGTMTWAQPIANRSFSIRGKELIWQPCLRHLKNADLVIVEQASRLLLNYLLLAYQRVGGPRVAFWGHGRNLRSHAASRLGESVKQIVSRRAHWWFAYTDLSARIVRDFGYPPDRITTVQNSIDTTSMLEQRNQLTSQELDDLRKKLKLTSRNVAIFVGGLYAEKRLDFLLAAAHDIRARIPDFELLVIGAGPEDELIVSEAQNESWIHYLGPLFEEAKVPFLSLGRVMLMPGLVGLAVIDSFAMEIPMVTVDVPFHSPEIEYLVHEQNGIKLPYDTTPSEYGKVVADLLQNEARMDKLKMGCRASASTYTMNEMVDRFVTGIRDAIQR